MDLLTIGAFARLARLSPKALRLYDELQLLPPVRVDPDTGYRWYSVDQLDRARRVSQLRRLNMPLTRIKAVLDLPADAMADALGGYWEEQEQGWRAKRDLVDFLVNQLTGKETPMFKVAVRDVPARTLLTTSEHVTADEIGEFATPLFALFGGPTVSRPEGAAGRPFLRYHGEVSNDSDAVVEFCCPVTADQPDIPDMARLSEDAGREAYIRVPKAEMRTALGFESLHQWLVDHEEQSDWKPRQIFLADPAAVDAGGIVYELAVRLL